MSPFLSRHFNATMDFPDDSNSDIRLALEKAEALARLSSAPLPDRLNEDWRFGRPHKHATALAAALADRQRPNVGTVRIEGAGEDVAWDMSLEEASAEEDPFVQSIGSDHLLNLHLKHALRGVCILLEKSHEHPITITYETDGLFTPTTCIHAQEGVKARIIERHIVRGEGIMFTTRRIFAMRGADISVELEEMGSGSSRCLNITNIQAAGATVRHLTQHSGHEWAREETLASILSSDADNPADLRLFSANRLSGHQVLDQHTRQIHSWGAARSDLLYKNVVDDHATAIFAGNIYVAPGAHDSDAYQSNRNMLLSEDATIHSLPGLEILADRVRCSHGSASAPMDEEQLFYMTSRGIPRREAQLLVAEGFLADALEKFRA